MKSEFLSKFILKEKQKIFLLLKDSKNFSLIIPNIWFFKIKSTFVNVLFLIKHYIHLFLIMFLE